MALRSRRSTLLVHPHRVDTVQHSTSAVLQGGTQFTVR